MPRKPKPPKTEAEWIAYRVKLNCKIGRDVLENRTKPPPDMPKLDYAIYFLLHAVEELAKK